MPNTRVERVHNAVGQANPPCDFLARPTIVMHYIKCEVFQDISILATRMDRLYCFIQYASKHLDLGLGPRNFKFLGLHLLVQCL